MNSDYKRYIERKAEICMSADSFSPKGTASWSD